MTLIQLRNIHKSYPMGDKSVAVLKGISFDIFEKEYVALIGQSGSGKSTLMHILGCLDVQSSGEYLLDGRHVGELDDDHLSRVRAQYIGFVFQTFNLLSKHTIESNVALPMMYAGIPSHERNERACEVLKKVGLEHRIGHRPGQLSGGERQRVAIARALVNRPKMILADEPTGNLDSQVAAEILALFDQLRDEFNLTIVMVTHSQEIANRTPRTIRLRDGKLEDV